MIRQSQLKPLTGMIDKRRQGCRREPSIYIS
jgi:hypothetical protein